jgi:hypothetical protein
MNKAMKKSRIPNTDNGFLTFCAHLGRYREPKD